MFVDKNGNFFIRSDSVVHTNKIPRATVLVSKNTSGSEVDITKCDYKWEKSGKNSSQDIDIKKIIYSASPTQLERGDKMWAGIESVYVDKDNKIYLKSDAKLFKHEGMSGSCVLVERLSSGFVLDIRKCNKRVQRSASVGTNDIEVEKVIF
jgi:hypothetical protein